MLIRLATTSASFVLRQGHSRLVHKLERTRSSSTTQLQTSRSDPAPLHGKTCLVTGSSGGIGKGIAHRFAEAGADVIVHYHSRKAGAVKTYAEINDRPYQGRCIGIIRADFRDGRQVKDMFVTLTDEILVGNRLDILVNNAGIVTKMAIEDDDESLSSWHETMAVNLHAPLQLMRLSHRHMKSTQINGRKGGVIINNTSIHGSRSVEYMQAYAASKAALDSLTRGLACEYAEDGIRVNAIAPGVVPVERTEEAFADPNVVDMWTPHLPVGRLGKVDDIADATLMLATNEWMTGSVVTVDGGMTGRANMPFRPRPAQQSARIVNGSSEDSTVEFEVPT